MNSNEITNPSGGEPVTDRPVVRPAVDVYESQEELLIVADLPGVAADGLSIDLEEDRLTISGRRAVVVAPDAKLLMGNDGDFEYKRVFTVPDAVDAEKIEAAFDAGVLTLRLPRHERTRPRRIAVQSA